VAATGLTLVAVPLLYYEFFKNRDCPLNTAPEQKKKEVEE
jgi:hypothetical protein